MTLRELHADFAWVVVVTNAVVGGWALATVLAELTIVLQVVLGVALVTLEDYEVAEFHAFYGFVALATIGIVYSYRHQLRPHLYLLYGLGGLFLMGLALRAITISPVPAP